LPSSFLVAPLVSRNAGTVVIVVVLLLPLLLIRIRPSSIVAYGVRVFLRHLFPIHVLFGVVHSIHLLLLSAAGFAAFRVRRNGRRSAGRRCFLCESWRRTRRWRRRWRGEGSYLPVVLNGRVRREPFGALVGDLTAKQAVRLIRVVNAWHNDARHRLS